jgi:hypothetical protein
VTSSEQDALHELMKQTAVALKQAEVPFALCGGYAAWARGAPEPEHDADFLVPESQEERAAKALTDAGLKVVEPAEDWLFKVVADEETFVDVIWQVSGHPVDDGLVQRAGPLQVLSVEMPVLAATDVVVTKLMALDEHYCDFSKTLPVARALREQVDWTRVREATAGNDFAVVFLVLLDRLGIVPAPSGA